MIPAARRPSGAIVIDDSLETPPAGVPSLHATARDADDVTATSVPPPVAKCAMPSPPVIDARTESASPVNASVPSSNVAAWRSLPADSNR
jgi:hypothetical protein